MPPTTKESNPITIAMIEEAARLSNEKQREIVGMVNQKESWEDEFQKEFDNLTLGKLSGDKGSPVFINNDLEVSRLKSFIREKIAEARQEERDNMLGEKKFDCWPGNCPFAKSEIPHPWGLSTEGWTEAKRKHNKYHLTNNK